MVLQLIATVVIKKIYPHTYTSNIFLANFPIMLLPSPQLSSQTIIPSITCNHTGSYIAFKTKYIIICFAQISAYCRVLFTGALYLFQKRAKMIQLSTFTGACIISKIMCNPDVGFIFFSVNQSYGSLKKAIVCLRNKP